MDSKASFDHLPEALIVDILSRLPVKTLIQSTCVRKERYSIIKSVSFISLHLSRSVSDPSRYYIFLNNDYSSSFALISDNPCLLGPFPEHLEFPFKPESTSPKTLIGACKGLVCLTDNSWDGHGIYLINPFIRKYRKLDVESSCYAPLIREMKDEDSDRIAIGFGYSETEDDYKVLRIIKLDNHQKRKRSTGSGYSKTKPLAEIYSLKIGQWKTLDVSIDFELPSTSDSATCVLGCLYWCMEKEEGKNEYLLCFDLKDEVFSKIELPTTYHELLSTTRYHHTFNKNDSLVVVLYDDPFMNSTSSKTNICLLVLEKNLDGHEEHWKEFSYKCYSSRFDPHEDPDFDSESGLNPLGFSVGGKLIFEVYYHVESKRQSYVVAVDLDNKCAIQEFGFSFNDHFGEHDIHEVYGTTNVLESHVLFLDQIALITTNYFLLESLVMFMN